MPSNHTLTLVVIVVRAGAGIEAVGVDLVEAESLVPVIQYQIEVLPIPPRPLSPAAAGGGGVVVSVVLSPAFTRHDDCGAGRPNNICLPKTQLYRVLDL